MVETLIIMIATLLITPSGLTAYLLVLFKVTKVNVSIFNPKYLIVGIVITLTLAPHSTNTSPNTDPTLHINDWITFTFNYYGIKRCGYLWHFMC